MRVLVEINRTDTEFFPTDYVVIALHCVSEIQVGGSLQLLGEVVELDEPGPGYRPLTLPHGRGTVGGV
jgi:hypothetical protein